MSGTHLPPAGLRSGAEVYQGSQMQLRSGRPAAIDRPRPLEFDRNGFPVAQRRPRRGPDFVARRRSVFEFLGSERSSRHRAGCSSGSCTSSPRQRVRASFSSTLSVRVGWARSDFPDRGLDRLGHLAVPTGRLVDLQSNLGGPMPYLRCPCCGLLAHAVAAVAVNCPRCRALHRPVELQPLERPFQQIDASLMHQPRPAR